ncbi:MAG TPA: FAD:protein FMN transferase [Acidimicrobiales bacterium]|nr:FAD:protein FMN transferase [Acidimicrobiales bacterium]
MSPARRGVVKRQVAVMGTVVSFDVRPGAAPAAAVHVALARAVASLHRVDHVLSTSKPDSPLSRLRRGEIGPEDAPPEVAAVLELCARARTASGGWFDPWAAPGGVDPTGLVKGWAAGRALDHLRRTPGLAGAMVNAGGDVACWGRPAAGRAWRIGVRSPDDAGVVLAVVEGVAAVATSGTYERGPHLFRPDRPLAPAGGVPVVSATVTGPELWMADALATGLAAGGTAGLDAVETLEGYEALVVDASGQTRATRGSPAEVVAAPAA